MKRGIWMVAAAAVLAAPAIAGAQDTMREGMQPQGKRGQWMSEPVKRSEVEQRLTQHFTQMDTDKDGRVTRAEYDAFKQQMRGQRMDQMFAAMDTSNDGQISKAEFSAFHASKGGGMKMRGGYGGMKTFGWADTNNDGAVTLAEARGRAMELFNKADANNDGVVTPEEHRAAHQQMRSERRQTKPATPN